MDSINSFDKPRVNVLLFVESRYKLNRKRLTQTIISLLSEQNIVSPVEVSLAIVGDRKMKQLNKKYRNKEGTTNVLSFPLGEGESTILPPSPKTDTNVMRLGDIVISYPQVIREAAAQDLLVDDKINELVVHSMLHLLGIHHD